MEHTFWHDKWAAGELGFHQTETNAFLQAHADRFDRSLPVLVPLCGKSKDMYFLAEQGYDVRGIEISKVAVEAFFHEHGLSTEFFPSHEDPDADEHSVGLYRAIESLRGNIEIYCGDFWSDNIDHWFEEPSNLYDRAAIVALPPAMRAKYVERIERSAVGRMLVIARSRSDAVGPNADQVGPPFSLTDKDIQQYYPQWQFTALGMRDSKMGEIEATAYATWLSR